MYPEILRELSAQRGAEMRDRAHRILFARRASKILRARRRGLVEADEFPVPAIPDYADGSFAAGPARAARQPDRVATTRRAA